MTNSADNTAAAVQQIREVIMWQVPSGHRNLRAALDALDLLESARDRNWDLLHDIEEVAINAGICESSGHALTDLVHEIPAALAARDQRIAELEAALRQVDDVLAVNWIAVPDGDYTFALGHLILRAIEEHGDPAVSEIAAARQSEMDAAIRRERAAQEGRNLVVAELQRIQATFGIRCVGGEPNFRVPEDRMSDERRDWRNYCGNENCRRWTGSGTGEECSWCASGMPFPGPQEPLGVIADAGDTRECGNEQKCARKDEGATGEDKSQL